MAEKLQQLDELFNLPEEDIMHAYASYGSSDLAAAGVDGGTQMEGITDELDKALEGTAGEE